MSDLISREALRKAFHERIWYFTKSSWDEANALIDNAPTVDTTCPHCDSGYAQGYSDGYLRGKEERPEVTVFCENADEKAIADMKEELQGVIDGIRPQGAWIVTAEDNDGVHRICCPFCSYEKGSNNTDPIIVTFTDFPKFCENCGANMEEGADND